MPLQTNLFMQGSDQARGQLMKAVGAALVGLVIVRLMRQWIAEMVDSEE